MKLKHIIILSLLLAILTIGAASASGDNATSDDLAAEVSDPVDASDDANENAIFNVTVGDDIREGIPFEVSFAGSGDLNGEIEMDVQEDEFYNEEYVPISNGTGTASLCFSSAGIHNIPYTFYNDDDGTFTHSSFNVNVLSLFGISAPSEVRAGTPFEVTFTAPDSVNGPLEIEIWESDGDYYLSSTVTAGKATLSLVANYVGVNEYEYIFNDNIKGVFAVKALDLFNISVPSSVYQGNKVTVTFTGNKSLNGYIDIDWEDVDRFAVKNGKATVTFTARYVKTVPYSFTSKDGKIYYEDEFAINVLKKPIIKANDFKKDYTSKKTYKVRVLDKNSKSVGAGKKVTFHLYKGSKKMATKTAKTDKNSYVKAKFNVAPGKYKVKTVYGPASVTKKYTVNSILKIKNEKRKDINKNMHTSNKIVWSVYLKKVDGKYLKGKKIKLTVYKQVFKGEKTYNVKVKTFTVKTNKKGVATITFKNSPVEISDYYMQMGIPFYVKTTYLKDRLLCGDLNSDPYYTLYAKNPYRYYFGPGWHAS